MLFYPTMIKTAYFLNCLNYIEIKSVADFKESPDL